MRQKWIPGKADATRVRRARRAKAVRAERRGKSVLEQEASGRADDGIEAMKAELDRREPQATQPDSGKRQ
jgi:hypothetical protein